MIEHEKAVIGLILNNPENYDLAAGYIDTIDFSEKIPGVIWSEIKKIFNQGITPSRHYVSNSFTDWLGMEAEKYISYINESCKYYEGDIVHHARIVKKKSKDRAFLFKLKIAPDQQKPDEFVIKALEEYQKTNEDKTKTFKQIINVVVGAIESVDDGITGLKTYIPALDRITGGLQPEKLYTIAARPGGGKTALASQILLNVAKHGIAVGNCSLEMGDDELGFRSIAYTCNANITGLYKGDEESLSKMSSGMRVMDIVNWPVYFNTEQDDLGSVLSQIRLWKIKYSIKLAVIDHIGLVNVPGADGKVQELTQASRAFKKLAKELKIPIIITCQINRSLEKSHRDPVMSDLKGSGSIEEDSDLVLFIHETKDDSNNFFHKFIIAKHRGGQKGYVGKGFIFDGPTQKFTEIGSY